jgi:hypothetical protein
MSSIPRHRPSPLTLLALAVLGALVLAQLADATHPRPKGATPLRFALVPAYKPCTAPNSKHGPPLAFPSCVPPEQVSNFLTVGTPDANGADANSVGSVVIKIKTTSPEDVLISGSVTDVRCKPATDPSVCSSANAAAGADYSGDLQGNAIVRATDHFNGQNLNEAGTVQDAPNPFTFHCVNTPDTSAGGTCTVDTSRPLIPQPYWFEGKRVVMEIAQMQVSDGGPDGNVFTQPQDNTLFAVQGGFIP